MKMVKLVRLALNQMYLSTNSKKNEVFVSMSIRRFYSKDKRHTHGTATAGLHKGWFLLE